MQTAPPSCSRHPHCTHYGKGQDPVHSWFNLWPLSNPSVLPWRAAYADHQPMLITITVYRHGSSTLLESSEMVETPSHTSLLAPSLTTHLEAKLGEVPSWNFSLGGWDEILLTGKQLGIWVGLKTNRGPEERWLKCSGTVGWQTGSSQPCARPGPSYESLFIFQPFELRPWSRAKGGGEVF